MSENFEKTPDRDKLVIAGASVYNKNYFENPIFALPAEVLKEIKEICVTYAEKLHCVFMIRFDGQGGVLFETAVADGDYNFDEIGAKLDIDRLSRDYKDLIHSLKLWYYAFYTEEGRAEAKRHFQEKNGEN